MIRFDQRNDPNPARLIESLRHIGYGNYEAIADLVDNCFDAEASRVLIRVGRKGEDFTVTVADDGIGMDREILDQALRLGSLTDRDAASDLGKFGMGLVTAGLSLSRRTEVITKQAGEYWTSIVDVDHIRETNSFSKHLAASSDDEIAIFDEILGKAESGTVVGFSKTDGMTNKNTTQFANVLRKHLGEAHRYFLMAGKTIEVNDEPVSAIDPLLWEHPETERYSDEVYPITIDDDGTKIVENIRARIALIPENLAAGESELARGLVHQGFYVLRNNRQIARAATLGFFSKHNDFNRMRGEIFFPGTLDNYVGIEFTKRQINFHQSIQDRLAEHLRGQCTSIKRREAGRGSDRITTEQALFHEQASKAITEKSRLLITPKAVVEKRKPRQHESSNKAKSTEKNGSERKNFERSQKAAAELRCRFLTQRLGPNGQIFECDLEGKTIVIRWNVEHPFYRRFVVDNQDDGRLVTAVDFLVYSMAAAELRARDEDHLEFINNMKAVISANLRTLLS